MMNARRFSLLFCFLFFLSALARAGDATTEYSDPGEAFTLRLPAAWESKRTDLGGGTWLTYFHPKGDETRDLTITVYASPPEMSLYPESFEPIGRVMMTNLLQLLGNSGTVAARPIEKTQFRQSSALRVDFTFVAKDKTTPAHSYLLALSGKRRVFVVGVSAPEKDEAGFRQIETLLDDLKLEPKWVEPPAARGLTQEALQAELDKTTAELEALIAGQSEGMEAPAANLTLEQARVEFEKREAERTAATTATPERAAAARAAMQAAAQAGWAEFEAGHTAEAATWFERRAALKKERYETWLAYYRTQIAATDKRLEELRAVYLAPPAGLGATLNALIGSWTNVQAIRAARLVLLAMQNNDSSTYLQYARMELDVRQQELQQKMRDGEDAAALNRQKTYIAAAYSNIGGAQEEMARFEDAAASYQKALEIRRALPADMPLRNIDNPLRDLGVLYSAQGDTERARNYYQQALEALDASAEMDKKALQQWQHAPEADAARFMELANAELNQSRGVLLNHVGGLEIDKGEYRAAAAYIEQAQQAVATLPDTDFAGGVKAAMLSSALGNMAVVYADTGETEKALSLNEEVIKLRRQIKDDPELALALLNQAGLFKDKGDYDSAMTYVMQARQIFVSEQDVRGLILTTGALAGAAYHAEHWEDAARYAQDALTLARKMGNQMWIGSAARALGNVRLKQGQLEAAHTLAREAAAADAVYNAPLATAATHDLQGRISEAQGHPEESLGHFQAAISLLEQVRSTANSESAFSNLESVYRYYDHIVRVLIKLGRAEEAFNYLNRAKSKKLRDEMQLASIKTGDQALQTLLKLTDALEKKLDSVRAQLQDEQARPVAEKDDQKIDNLKLVAASTQAEFFQTVNRIKAEYPDYEKVVTVSPKELKKAQSGIPEGAVMVQYAPLGAQLYVFIVTRDALKIYTPPAKPDDVWKRVREFRSLMEDAGRDLRAGQSLAITGWDNPEPATAALRKNLSALYDMLLAPIQPELDKATTIAFIPTGLLYYLPMHALGHQTEKGWRFLLEDKQVAYLAAADVLSVVQTRDPARLGKGLLAFGDPTGADLPQALDEVQTIATVFPAAHVLSGDDATKAALEKDDLNQRILHFATHGVLNPAQPGQSYIQLAPGATPEAARLTVGEVYGLDLKHLDLVTLSACQTALGQRNPDGSEITSLAESFSVAGAPSVIASLWSVSDASTRDTMVAFYRALADGAGKAAALRSAQLEVLHNPKYRHPYFWAPFELMGDWR
jgi:tetratricopeptide (TPR) repeat protein